MERDNTYNKSKEIAKAYLNPETSQELGNVALKQIFQTKAEMLVEYMKLPESQRNQDYINNYLKTPEWDDPRD